jgi:hypothetical protein
MHMELHGTLLTVGSVASGTLIVSLLVFRAVLRPRRRFGVLDIIAAGHAVLRSS